MKARLKGHFTPEQLRRYLVSEALIFWGLILLCRLLYPAENRFSIMTHTFSFLGSFDAKHNPRFWFLFTIALVFWGLFTVPLVLFLHRRLRGSSPWAVWPGTLLLLEGCLGMVLVGIFPDAHGKVVGDLMHTHVHQDVALMAFAGYGLGIPWMGALLLKDQIRWIPWGGRRLFQWRKSIFPFAFYIVIFSIALYFQLKWEVVYSEMKANAQATGAKIGSHWSEALNTVYSFPLWENVLIYTMYTFMAWFPLTLLEENREALSQDQIEKESTSL